jgi:uncharacterized membrane-anchored protein YhcB (DUF1043 family)
LIAIIALAAGIGIGYLSRRFLRPQPPSSAALEEQLHTLQERYKHHRYDVNAHFNRTAELLGQLANSYREVHNHLAQGAQDLCDTDAVKMLKPLPDHNPVLEERHPTVIEPPRDYAPRSGPYEKGLLDEDFGLEKPRRGSLSEPPHYL